MNDVRLPVLPPIFPPDYCLEPQKFANDLAAGLQVILPGVITVWSQGPNAPGIAYRDRPWRKIDPTTGVSVGDFDWSPLYGKWLKQHFTSGTPSYQIVPSTTNLDTYDGGESGAATPIAGPFWKQYDGVTPITPPTNSIYIVRTTRFFDRAS